MDEEGKPEPSSAKGKVETGEAEGTVREVNENRSWAEENEDETKSPTTADDEPGSTREAQFDDGVQEVLQSVQDHPIVQKIGTERGSPHSRVEEEMWNNGNERIPSLEELAGLVGTERIPSLEELAGLKIDEVTNDGNLIVATRTEPPISDEDKRELIGHSVRRQVRRRNYVNKDANLERETSELTPEELWKQEFKRRERSGTGIQRTIGELAPNKSARAMVVSKEEKIKGNYDALRWTEEQEREPEGMPELDREALSKEGIPEECEENDVLRGRKKKRKMPRRRKKKHVGTTHDTDGRAKERELEVKRIMEFREKCPPMQPYPRWERFARQNRVETGEKPTAMVMMVE